MITVVDIIECNNICIIRKNASSVEMANHNVHTCKQLTRVSKSDLTFNYFLSICFGLNMSHVPKIV